MIALKPNIPCPCESGKKYKACCRPYHHGTPAPTPEALMRSRYSAYAGNLIDYIMATTHPDSPHHQTDRALWIKEITDFTRYTQFDGLDILATQIHEDAAIGWVTFCARLTRQGRDISFTEKSRFEKYDNVWKYLSGEVKS